MSASASRFSLSVPCQSRSKNSPHYASSTERAASVRRHVEPDRGTLRAVLGRIGDDADLRAVSRFDHVVTARAQKHLPRHCARYDVLRSLRLAGPQPHRMLADRNGAFAAGHQLAAAAAQGAAREREMSLVEHLAL